VRGRAPVHYEAPPPVANDAVCLVQQHAAWRWMAVVDKACDVVDAIFTLF
jgi:hypothetical protein